MSAAQYHGAAHHRPQVFQVALAGNLRPISCGAVGVSFIARKRIAEVAVQSFNTPRGTILVSSVEATAVDLVGYEQRVGELDQVATMLSELAERIDPDLLAGAARTAPVPWAQRLGYLLERIGAADKTAPLKAHVRRRARDIAPLLPAGPRDRAPRLLHGAERRVGGAGYQGVGKRPENNIWHWREAEATHPGGTETTGRPRKPPPGHRNRGFRDPMALPQVPSGIGNIPSA